MEPRLDLAYLPATWGVIHRTVKFSDKAHYVAFGHEKAPPGHSPEGQLSGSDNPALCQLDVGQFRKGNT